MKTAITGGIGSGKSYVCSLLMERGIRVYDCDTAAKRIMRGSAGIQSRLARLIGDSLYAGGRLDKSMMAAYILSSSENAARVNAIVHPAVAEDFLASGASFMECAILFESGFDRLVDRVVTVTAPLEVRVRRIMARDNITDEKAREWIACQMPQEEMAHRSDCVICNDGATPLDRQIDKMLEMLSQTEDTTLL